jgi:ADP-ribosyl-[dinitrogen reductase] hydrolase
MNLDQIKRARGSLLGLAVGDAIGTTVEFKARGSYPLVTDMTGGGPFSLNAGEWTDDTSMALCLGASLIEKGFDLNDQIQRYIKWCDDGYMSSNGRCFDIGMATRKALQNYRITGNPESGALHPNSAGNGCIMRLAPISIMYAHDMRMAIHLSGEQSKTTHRAIECIEASKIFGAILVRALNGSYSKEQVLINKNAETDQISSIKLKQIDTGGYFNKNILDIRGSGYVVDSLEAALWCFYQTDNFKEAVLAAANLGDDADTTAAIVGQLAGAFYGEDDIPESWLNILVMRKEIGEMAESLVKKIDKPVLRFI